MSEMREGLELMRELARTRIHMLEDGLSLYSEAKKCYYINEYRSKLHELDQLIRRYSVKAVRPGENLSCRDEDSDTTLH